MMFFTDKGRMYRLLVNDIPSGTNASKGVNIGNLIALDANEKIISVSSLKRKSLPKYIIFVTRKGLVKKSLLSAYTTTKRSGGVKALKLAEGDEVAKVLFQDDEEIILVTKNGNVLRFESSKVAPIGKDCTGVKGISLKGDDYIVTALSLHKYSDDLFIAHANGLGKKINTDELPIQNRGGVGVTVGKDEVAGAAMISNADNIIVTGTANSICISAKDIPLQGRATQGAALIKGNVIKSIAKI
jgi:DNA gyrase subunit A